MDIGERRFDPSIKDFKSNVRRYVEGIARPIVGPANGFFDLMSEVHQIVGKRADLRARQEGEESTYQYIVASTGEVARALKKLYDSDFAPRVPIVVDAARRELMAPFGGTLPTTVVDSLLCGTVAAAWHGMPLPADDEQLREDVRRRARTTADLASVMLCARGADGFTALWPVFQKAVAGALNVEKDPVNREDLRQIVFVKLLKNHSRLRVDSAHAVRAYVRRVTLNAAIDLRLRQQRLVREADMPDEEWASRLEFLAGPVVDSAGVLFRSERIRAVSVALLESAEDPVGLLCLCARMEGLMPAAIAKAYADRALNEMADDVLLQFAMLRGSFGRVIEMLRQPCAASKAAGRHSCGETPLREHQTGDEKLADNIGHLIETTLKQIRRQMGVTIEKHKRRPKRKTDQRTISRAEVRTAPMSSRRSGSRSKP